MDKVAEREFTYFAAFAVMCERMTDITFNLVRNAKIGIKATSYITKELEDKLHEADLNVLLLGCRWIDDNFYRRSYDC